MQIVYPGKLMLGKHILSTHCMIRRTIRLKTHVKQSSVVMNLYSIWIVNFV